MTSSTIPVSVIERFWAKVQKSGPDECWLWTASCKTSKYGQFNRGGGVTVSAHRMAWELTVGPIPKGADVRHMCEGRYVFRDKTYRRCCNPAHLATGSRLENAADCMKAKRIPIREQCRNYKYTDEQVMLCICYSLVGKTAVWIGALLNINPWSVFQFVGGRCETKNAALSRSRTGI